MITLAPAPFVTNPLTRCGMYSGPTAPRTTGGPEGLLARCVGFKGNSLHAHRYNGQPDGTHLTPPAGGGKMHTYNIPVTAVYVVWSYNTPIAWVDSDGTVTVPDIGYSNTTRAQQNQCRAWLGAAVPGTSANLHHIEQGYRSA